MTGAERKYVAVEKRGDRTYRYLRYKGRRIPLVSDPNSSDFEEEYQAALAAASRPLRLQQVAADSTPRSIQQAVDQFLSDPETADVCAAWKRERKNAFAPLLERIPDENLRDLKWKHIKAVRNKHFRTPVTMNRFVNVMQAFMNWAVDNEIVEFNPIPRGKKAKLKENTESHEPWSDSDVANFRDHWPVGTSERLAFELIACTAARCANAVKLGRTNIHGSNLVFKPVKDGDEVSVPISDDLRDALGERVNSQYFIRGRWEHSPKNAASLSQLISDAAKLAGLQTGRTAHGIR
ncbi:MAG: hypothetical protein EON58_21585, partial [Alphaproteobacteria bacterium]